MKVKKFIEKNRLTGEKIRKVSLKVTSEIVCARNGSGIVEYVAIAGAALVVIVMVILPGMKNLFNVDIFPGLTSQVNKIYGYT